jgi:two-component system, NtrC family, response regulator AtoC
MPVTGPRKVLVVDDEQNECNALAELLRDDGYEVETAPDGRTALVMLETFGPDVVITDLQMPVMDGHELVTLLRQRGPRPTIIVMTEYGRNAAAIDALRLGAHDYLTKPIGFDELLIVLRRVIEQGGGARDATSYRHEPHNQQEAKDSRPPRSP